MQKFYIIMCIGPLVEVIPAESTEEVRAYNKPQPEIVQSDKENNSGIEKLDAGVKCNPEIANDSSEYVISVAGEITSSLPVEAAKSCCTPAPMKLIENKKSQTAKRVASILKNPSVLNSKNSCQYHKSKALVFKVKCEEVNKVCRCFISRMLNCWNREVRVYLGH